MSLSVWLVVGAGLTWLWRALRPRLLPSIPCVPFSTPLGHLPAMIGHVGGTAELSTFFESSMDKLGAPPIAQVILEPGGKPWLLVADVQEIADISSARCHFFEPADSAGEALASVRSRYATHIE